MVKITTTIQCYTYYIYSIKKARSYLIDTKKPPEGGNKNILKICSNYFNQNGLN